MARAGQSGRTRIVVTGVLVVVIGAAGALTLPRLLDESEAPRIGPATGSICFLAPGPRELRKGELRVVAERPGAPGLDRRQAVPAGAEPASVASRLAAALAAAGWGEAAGVTVEGPCLQFETVTAVGGDPGGTGAAMTLSLAARAPAGGEAEVRLGRAAGAARGRAGRVALTAQRPAAKAEGGPGVVEASVAFDAEDDPFAILLALADVLAEGRWSLELASGPPAVLTLTSLPDGTALGALSLSVEYTDELPATDDPQHVWTISLE